MVRAAGGVVWRRSGGAVEVVLVHRPAYDDWSLPKGKAHHHESDEEAALREVEEETGLSCSLGEELPGTTYVDSAGRDKSVRYWEMAPCSGQLGGAGGARDELRPGPAAAGPVRPGGVPEVDEARWWPLGEARERLSYRSDLVVLDGFAELIGWSEVRRQEANGVLEGEPQRQEAH
jgi:8-oxo-dGTP diphosphatase